MYYKEYRLSPLLNKDILRLLLFQYLVSGLGNYYL